MRENEILLYIRSGHFLYKWCSTSIVNDRTTKQQTFYKSNTALNDKNLKMGGSTKILQMKPHQEHKWYNKFVPFICWRHFWIYLRMDRRKWYTVTETNKRLSVMRAVLNDVLELNVVTGLDGWESQ